MQRAAQFLRAVRTLVDHALDGVVARAADFCSANDGYPIDARAAQRFNGKLNERLSAERRKRFDRRPKHTGEFALDASARRDDRTVW
jgi:hypothetical protein